MDHVLLTVSVSPVYCGQNTAEQIVSMNYTQEVMGGKMNSGPQRIARRGKKAFLSDQ